jgi:8-oxo-dGTP pyrophosphatase MutT (NUDIX family)
MAVTPRPSAAVVLIRPSQRDADTWETYLLRRSAQSPVLAEMWVFPGGTVRPDDVDAAAQTVSPTLTPSDAHAIFSRPPDLPAPTPIESYAHFVAAGRELIEEAGIVLMAPGESASEAAPRAALAADRREALEHGLSLAEFIAQTGIVLGLDRLVYYAHWITPEAIPQRFDTRFFLARLPEGQEASPSPFEMADGQWIEPNEALERARALSLHFATFNHLRRLAPYRGIDELFRFAESKSVIPVMPSTRETDGRVVPFLPPEVEGVW